MSEIRGSVYATEAEALAACVVWDAVLGLPKPGTDRWTIPIELVDGWLVQSPDGSGDVISRDRLKLVEE